MTRPDWTPEDVREEFRVLADMYRRQGKRIVAEGISDGVLPDDVRAAAAVIRRALDDAIGREREACAVLAYAHGGVATCAEEDRHNELCMEIAQAIRARSAVRAHLLAQEAGE